MRPSGLTDRIFTRVIPLAALSIALIALGIVLSTPQSIRTDNQGAAVQARGINADKVDGLHASKKPRAGRLLALDKRGKFPASVFPSGLSGPQGPTGPAGAAGVNGADGAVGPAGATGATGSAGPTGTTGAVGISGRETVSAESAFDATDQKAAMVNCPGTKVVIGGGASATSVSVIPPVAISVSQPQDLGFPFNTSGWIAYANEITPLTSNWKLVVFAICVNVAA